MSGPNLPTNVDASYPGSPTDPTADIHQQHHDTLHRFANRFDIDAIPGDGQVLTFEGASNLYKPKNQTTGGAAADLTGTPLVVSAASGGTGTYPARPATTRPVSFRGQTQPTTDGSTAGGGGMVPGLDDWRYWTSGDASGIASAAVGTAKVADGAVTLPKIAPGVVGLQIRVARTAAQGVPVTAADFDAAGIAIGDFFTVDP